MIEMTVEESIDLSVPLEGPSRTDGNGGSGRFSLTSADTALKFSTSAVFRRSNSAISDVLSIAPDASSRLIAAARSPTLCELTPSTNT